MISEVIPKAQINPIEVSALNIDGYDVYVNFDISKPYLGACRIRGVTLYVKEDLNVSEVTFCAEFKEIPLSEKHSLLCGVYLQKSNKGKRCNVKKYAASM